MCKRKSFAIAVSGEKAGREKLVGCLVENSCNLVTEFGRTDSKTIFFFNYRGDARLVLKRMSYVLTGKRTNTVDVLKHGGAEAIVYKLS